MITTRFAPSPTGFVHIGSLRTVLYNYLFAKKENGKFMIRIEDTDRTRLVEGSVENLISVLEQFGLEADEGPNKPGKLGPYYQSERLEIYRKYIDELIANDKAYYCFCSSERLDELRKEQESLKLATKYDGHCRYLTQEEIKAKLDNNEPYTVRLKVPKDQKIVFVDGVKGRIEMNTKDVDDQVLLKTDGFPTYHMASIVDDHLMQVSHVIRGDEWLPSTPKHILLYEAFGWEIPKFYHLPLILGKDKKKLSKRTGDVSCESYLEKGYPIKAIINYIALLGWNPKTTQEFFTIEELIEKFTLDNLTASPAVFDTEKLDWFSSKYIANMMIEELKSNIIDFYKKYDQDFASLLISQDQNYLDKIINELKTRLVKYSDFKNLTSFFWNDEYDMNTSLLLNEKMGVLSTVEAKKSLEFVKNILLTLDDNLSLEEIKEIFINKIKQENKKNGRILFPTRACLSGEQFSPGAFELIYILGNKKALLRIEKVLKKI